MKQLIKELELGFITEQEFIYSVGISFNLKVAYPKGTHNELALQIAKEGKDITKDRFKEILDNHADKYNRENLVEVKFS